VLRTATLGILLCSSLLRPTAAQDSATPQDVLIKLERTSCFGECPVYSVTIDGEGNVTYEGEHHVRVQGQQTARINPARVTELLDLAERIRFFDFKDQYRFIEHPDGTHSEVGDLSTQIVTIRVGGRSKRVEDYIGAPPAIKDLEKAIDDAAYTKRWVTLDAATLDRMSRDGWRPATDEMAELLRKALTEDNVFVVNGLLALGADANSRYFDTHAPALNFVHSAAAAQALIEAGAIVTARGNTGYTPLWWAVHLPPDVAATLIRAGARPDDPVGGAAITPLWYAACEGNVGVVNVLLRAGANAAAAHGYGQSAVDCAKDRRARDVEYKQSPDALQDKPPFTRDFDQTIALLEAALAKASRR
jgi:hypothetical protein